jgi:hypothetical protein
MAILYFDIETFSNGEFKPENLKIISVQYKDIDKGLKILREWKTNERCILEEFYNYLKETSKNENVMLIGLNILRFDIPNIIHRLHVNKIDTLPNLLNLFHNIFTIDIAQCLLPFNDYRFKGLSAENLAKKLNLPGPKHRNDEIDGFYKNKEFEKIEEHIISDIKFLEDIWWVLRKDQSKLKLIKD